VSDRYAQTGSKIARRMTRRDPPGLTGAMVSVVSARRLGIVMEPQRDNPLELEGVLNPGAARGPDGQLYLFPRVVARGNYSRIAIARVRFDDDGNPVEVDRLGIALEPTAPYERRPDGGGCEDPRVTYLEPLREYVMTYTAYGPEGPRVALALSKNLLRWTRLGLANFAPLGDISFENVPNKDAVFFPTFLIDPQGRPALAIIHRPLFPGTTPEELISAGGQTGDVRLQSMWISYAPLDAAECDPLNLCHFILHRRLAAPQAPWEQLKVGAGTPPVLTDQGYAFLYHGVSDGISGITYAAGFMVVDPLDPLCIRYRSPTPILRPERSEELWGTVPRVVFPTAIDRRIDLAEPKRLDVYYGMADRAIGVARLDLGTSTSEGAR
jgi:predicted GH43/DUF377 family glycosyl hydrolase